MTVVPSVTFKRVLLPPDAGGPTVGEDVRAVKAAVSRMGFWPWQEFDDVMSNAFAHGQATKARSGLAGFQRSVGIEASGRYGKLTHDALLKARVPAKLPHAGEYAFDAHSLILYGLPDAPTYREQIATDIYKWWDWMVAHEPQIGYLQYRPMTELRWRREPPRLPFNADCSSAFIYAAFLGGAISPDAAYGFSGYGNTTSLIRCGVPITLNQVAEYAREHYIGAFYGPSRWDTRHIVAVKSLSRVYSHGRPGAPETHSSSHYRGDLVEIRAYEVA